MNLVAIILTALALPTAAQTSKLDFATTNDVLGMNPAYIEKRLGIPRRKTSTSLEFQVAGCKIRYSVNKTEITGFNVDITPTCSPKINDQRITRATTLKTIAANNNGEYHATCLYSCGNSENPTMYFGIDPHQANGLLSIRYHANHANPYANKAWFKWKDAVEKSYPNIEFGMLSTAMEPTETAAPANIVALTQNATVETVYVGGGDDI